MDNGSIQVVKLLISPYFQITRVAEEPNSSPGTRSALLEGASIKAVDRHGFKN
jgi:hypothetical protein